jgi:hypothetical protein
VQQYADDLLQNRTAWDRLTAQATQLQVQTLTCEVIVHKPVFIAGSYDPGRCEPATLQPGTPPSFTKGTPGSWTPGRAAYFTPGFWCAIRGRLRYSRSAKCSRLRMRQDWRGGAPLESRRAASLPARHQRYEKTFGSSARAVQADHGSARAGTVIPGVCTPPSYTKATLVPGWTEKKDCPL